MSNPSPSQPTSAAETIRKLPPVKAVASYSDLVEDFVMFAQWLQKQAGSCEGVSYRPAVDLAYIVAILYGYYTPPDAIRRCLFPTQGDKDRLVGAIEPISGRISSLRYTAKSGASKPPSTYSSLFNIVINSAPYEGEEGDGDLIAELDADGPEGDDDNTF